ncbi:hypothetical protein P167DRAFT_565090 [Morchella conica CCBAS932]|uniref:Uncharacterized protein n=1 Tax=Morchella conica CCBAS932 TaxID=1392247 RepID=A0A3N4KWK5_9PEZI|nr:hypothetical protein P167DRAFT_565090 [Morchella conica CCBAS932]
MVGFRLLVSEGITRCSSSHPDKDNTSPSLVATKRADKGRNPSIYPTQSCIKVYSDRGKFSRESPVAMVGDSGNYLDTGVLDIIISNRHQQLQAESRRAYTTKHYTIKNGKAVANTLCSPNHRSSCAAKENYPNTSFTPHFCPPPATNGHHKETLHSQTITRPVLAFMGFEFLAEWKTLFVVPVNTPASEDLRMFWLEILDACEPRLAA